MKECRLNLNYNFATEYPIDSHTDVINAFLEEVKKRSIEYVVETSAFTAEIIIHKEHPLVA